jgi:hypothetical protein
MTFPNRAPLASPETFRRRIITNARAGIILIAISLAVGIAGYKWLEDMDLVDAFLNAAMILSGMGPLDGPTTVAGKIFAGCYAIYCGFAVLAIAAVMFAPIVHRIFHRMHLEDTEKIAEPVPTRKRPRGK